MTTSRPIIEQEYAAARPKSKALFERARQVMPSGAAHDGRVFSPFPFYVERADGARKWDVDGHEYLDCWSGHGALMLGHNHPAVVKAITEQARRGLHYSACSELEVRWAELIRSCVPGAERVRFTLTGTETTSLAVRVARAFTGRDYIVKFESHFHGVHDMFVAAVKDPFEIPASAGVPASTLSTTLVARCNDIAHVRELLDEHSVAAIILEPAGGRSMTVPTNPAFLKALREETKKRGVILIFDEVVTGFRLAAGGAQEYFGVTADLTCLAKAVAGGLPGAALVGRADLMDGIAFTGDAKRDRTKRVADQGTYSGTPLVAAAAIAQLEILKTGEVQRELNRKGDRLRAGMNQVLKTRGVRGCVYGGSSLFRIFLGADAAELGLDEYTLDAARLDRGMGGALSGGLHLAMLVNGVDFSRGNAHGWMNGAMTDKDVDQIVDAFDRSLVRMQEERLLGVNLGTWWESFFDADYVRLWEGIEAPGATERQVAGLWEVLGLKPDSLVLDAPCGYGRISRALAERGARVVGVDRATDLLAEAERRRGDLPADRLRYLNHDLRAPLTESGFDGALNIFSSLGYGTQADDVAVLSTLRAAVRPGGLVFVETMHRDRAAIGLSQQQRFAHRLPDGTLVVEEPRLDPVAGRIESTWYWSGPGGSGQKRACFRVYTTTELVAILESAGLRLRSVHNGCSPEPFVAPGSAIGGRLGLLAIRE